MPDIYSTAKGSDGPPPNPLLTKYDESGRIVQVIEPAGKPPTIFFCNCGDGRESSEEESGIERLDPPVA